MTEIMTCFKYDEFEPLEHISENNNYVIEYMGESLKNTIWPGDKFWKPADLKKHILPGQNVSTKQRPIVFCRWY